MNNKGFTVAELVVSAIAFSAACGIFYVVAHFVIKFW